MILIVVALSFLVLLLAFRSLLVPLKAAVMNLLSVAAAYGVVTFVFQEGHGGGARSRARRAASQHRGRGVFRGARREGCGGGAARGEGLSRRRMSVFPKSR